MLLILLEVSVKVTHWLMSLGLMLKDYFYATCTYLLVKATCQLTTVTACSYFDTAYSAESIT